MKSYHCDENSSFSDMRSTNTNQAENFAFLQMNILIDLLLAKINFSLQEKSIKERLLLFLESNGIQIRHNFHSGII